MSTYTLPPDLTSLSREELIEELRRAADICARQAQVVRTTQQALQKTQEELADTQEALTATQADKDRCVLISMEMMDLIENDPMTGLTQHAFGPGKFHRLLARQIKARIRPSTKPVSNNKRRKNSTACFLMCDLDNFKTINDTFGHMMGDVVLIAAANVLKSHARRKEDLKFYLITREGGEEMALLLFVSDPKDGVRLAESIRSSIAQMKFIQTKTGMYLMSEGSIFQWMGHAANALPSSKTKDPVFQRADEIKSAMKGKFQKIDALPESLQGLLDASAVPLPPQGKAATVKPVGKDHFLQNDANDIFYVGTQYSHMPTTACQIKDGQAIPVDIGKCRLDLPAQARLVTISTSIGAAFKSIPQLQRTSAANDPFSVLKAQADPLLYQAKANGRNQVAYHIPTSVSHPYHRRPTRFWRSCVNNGARQEMRPC